MDSIQSAKPFKFYFIAFFFKSWRTRDWGVWKIALLHVLKKIQTVQKKAIINNLNVLRYTNGRETPEKLNCCISHQEDANCGDYGMTSIQKQGIWKCKWVQ